MRLNSGLVDPQSRQAVFLEPGVYKVSRSKLLGGPGTHFGVLVLDAAFGFLPRVYHQQTDGHKLVSVEEFAQDHLVTVGKRVVGWGARKAVQTIRRLLREQRPFDFLSNNCEHATNEVVEGKHESGQIQVLVGALAIGLIALLASKAG